MLRPEDGIIICREVVVALVCLFRLSYVSAMAIRLVIFCAHACLRDHAQVIRVIKKLVFDCNVDFEEVAR